MKAHSDSSGLTGGSEYKLAADHLTTFKLRRATVWLTG